MMSNHLKFINLAHDIASKNLGKTFPNPSVGCIISKNNRIISRGVTSSTGRPHAEEIALKKAGKKSTGATMYVTLEPCAMCCGLLIHSRIENLIFSALDPKSGAVMSNANLLDADFINHKVNYSQGPLEKQSSELLKSFFRARRL